jgi:hypothetical protein
VSVSRSIPIKVDGITTFGGQELARATGFDITEIAFVAPVEPGDYVIAVTAQLGTADRTYREFDTVFFYRLRVTAD